MELRDILYGFSPLHLLLGRAPLIASIIWGYSIYGTWSRRRPTPATRAAALLLPLAILALGHALGLQALKHVLGW